MLVLLEYLDVLSDTKSYAIGSALASVKDKMNLLASVAQNWTQRKRQSVTQKAYLLNKQDRQSLVENKSVKLAETLNTCWLLFTEPS